MNGITIQYKKGYKYQLHNDFKVFIPIKPAVLLKAGSWIRLRANGLLILKHGYAWDGPSGPTFDSKTFMRGSLIHDALYQLMREGQLDRNVFRDQVDQLLRETCLEDGMGSIRAWYVYRAVKNFGHKTSLASWSRKVLQAP